MGSCCKYTRLSALYASVVVKGYAKYTRFITPQTCNNAKTSSSGHGVRDACHERCRQCAAKGRPRRPLVFHSGAGGRGPEHQRASST